MARLIRLGEDDGSFDRKFWKKIGPHGIFEAMCQMVEDHFKWGKNAYKPRLQRSVAVLKRKER